MPTRRPITELTEHERALAVARFAVLRPFLEDGVPLTRLAAAQLIPLRTARRWVQQYRQHGLVGLVRARRADHAQPRRIAADLRQFIEGMALQRPPLSVAAVHRHACQVAVQYGWPRPSYSTVYAIVRQLDPALVVLAHAGVKTYQEMFDMIYRREATRPNELWQADHTLLDVWLWDEHGRAARPWITVILDDHSRAVAGYRIGFQVPTSMTTALTLRQAIWRKTEPQWHVCGIPDTFYTDHGSDFTSQHLEQVSADLKMRLVFSQAGRPQGRGRIERFFNTVNQLFLCTVPGYTPAGAAPTTPQWTLPQFETRFHAFLLDEYHLRPHSAIDGAPQARWDAAGFLPRLPDTLEALDILLLTVAKTRRVQQDGIRFQGLRYHDLTLAAYIGEDVIIRYDPRDMAEIRVYHQDTFVCRAVCQEVAGQTISLKDIVAARRDRQRRLRAGLTDRAAVVERLLAVHEPETVLAPPVELPAAAPRLKRYRDD